MSLIIRTQDGFSLVVVTRSIEITAIGNVFQLISRHSNKITGDYDVLGEYSTRKNAAYVLSIIHECVLKNKTGFTMPQDSIVENHFRQKEAYEALMKKKQEKENN